MKHYLLIAIGGGCGSMARYWVTVSLANRFGIGFPYGTMAVTLVACVVIGFSITGMLRRSGKQSSRTSPWRYLLAVGFIGAFSTFSTFEWDTLTTLRSGALLVAALYATLSLAVGLIAIWTGTKISEAIS
jgi:CrcB protein